MKFFLVIILVLISFSTQAAPSEAPQLNILQTTPQTQVNPVSTTAEIANPPEVKANQASQVTLINPDSALASASVVDPYDQARNTLLKLSRYNIYYYLPKVELDRVLVKANLASFAYGPFEYDDKIYGQSHFSVADLDIRIQTLGEILTKSASLDAKADSTIIAKRVYWADLQYVKARITKNPSDYYKALEAYKPAFKDAKGDIYEAVAFNTAHILVKLGDALTALPILKKIYKDNFTANNEFLRQASADLLDLYFWDGRYQKAYEEIADKLKNQEVSKENQDYQLRVGDTLFFLKHYQEASEWYQNILKPDANNTPAQTMSWLYLAESLYQLEKYDVAKKIYIAMKPYFEGSIYESVIDYRLSENAQQVDDVLQMSDNEQIISWIKLDTMQREYFKNPQMFSEASFQNLRDMYTLDDEMNDQVTLLVADSRQNLKDYQGALDLYHGLEIKSKDNFINDLYGQIIVEILMRQGMATFRESEADHYLKSLVTYQFYLRQVDSDRIYNVLYHNLERLGLQAASPELTLHILDLSIQSGDQKARIYLRLAKSFYDARVYYSTTKALDAIDKEVLSFEDKEQYFQISINTYLATNRFEDALQVLDQWLNTGSSARNSYWIALKKVEINMKLKNESEALHIIETVLGDGKIDQLPPDYEEFVAPLLANQVILDNRIGKNNECLVSFYVNQDRLLKTEFKADVILAVISSALAMNKEKDIDKILASAKTALDEKTFAWLDKWARGEMWVNQINRYIKNNKSAVTATVDN